MSFDVGAITGKILLDATGWQKGIDQIVASKTGIENITQAVKNIGAAFDPVFRACGQLINEFAKDEMAAIKLNAVLKATGGAAGITSEQIKKLGAELQKTTMFEDDAVINAAAIAATYTHIGKDVFPQMIKAAADLATVYGGDLASNTMTLAKALENPAENMQLLNRQTKAFSEEQIKFIKGLVESGKQVEAQNYVLEVLAQKVGGAAEAMGESAAGKMKRFENAIGDVKEMMGGLIFEIVGPAIDFLRELLVGFNSMPDGLGKTAIAVTALGVVMTAVFGPAGLVVAAVVGLVALGKAMEANGPDALIQRQQEEKLAAAMKDSQRVREIILKQMGTMTDTLIKNNVYSKEEMILAYQSVLAYMNKAGAMVSVGGYLDVNIQKTKEYVEIQKKLNDLMGKPSGGAPSPGAGGSPSTAETGIPSVTTEAGGGWAPHFAGSGMPSGAIAGAVAGVANAGKTVADANAKMLDEIKTTTTNAVSFIGQAVGTIASLWSAFYKGEETKIDNDYKKKKRIIETTIKDEKKQKDALEALEKETAAKKAELKKKEFESNKAAAIIQAIISTSLGVVGALSTPPPWLGIAMAAIIGVLGAAQIALIASQPVPEFAGGGIANPGLALVGERGPELVNIGTTSRIIPNSELSRLGQGNFAVNFYGDVNSEVDLDAGMERAYRKYRGMSRKV